MDPQHTSNGKKELIRKQIGDAIEKVERSADGEDVCSSHGPLSELGILSIRVGEMVMDEVSVIKEMLIPVLEQRMFNHKLWRLVGIVFGAGGILGSILLVIQVVKEIH